MKCFTRTPDQYAKMRDQNIIKNWKKQTAFYLSVMKGIDIQTATEFLEWGVKNKKLDFTDPVMKIFRRDEHGDRYEDVVYASRYLHEVSSRGLVMAPTLTCYLPYKEKPSTLGKFTWREFTERKRIKKEGQIAKSYGRMQEATDKGNQQNKKKEGINSISGALTIASNPISNRSGHSTLTSICRTATAFANANTERLLLGRRYFPDGLSVLENMTTILSDVDMDSAVQVIRKYNLHLVTADELYQALRYSYDSYWRSEKWNQEIYRFVEKLTPEQRSVYLYTGDMYHLRVYNEDFVRNFFDSVHQYKQQSMVAPEENDAEFKNIDDYYGMFVTSMVADDVGSLSIFAQEHRDKAYFGKIGAYSKWVRGVIDDREDYFRTFWNHKYLPAETALFPNSIRRGVLGGDTDSVLNTVIEWARWYHNSTDVFFESKVTSQFVVFLLCMMIRHSLAVASAQMGVDEKYIHLLEMKNEFFFDCFSPSNRTKHYVNIKSACEGLNYESPELEVKGVALKNSRAPQEIMDGFNDKVQEILEHIAKGGKIVMKDMIDHVAKLEASIFESVMHGDVDYLPSCSIKVKEAYKIPMSSDYANYELWESVFADKYGHAPELPYEGVRISLNLPNKTSIRMWLDRLEDKNIANKFEQFLEKTGRKAIASIVLPYETIAQSGIPHELKLSINARKIIFSNMEPYYILLEMLGNYYIDRWLTKMCLDERMEFIKPDLRHYFDNTIEHIDMDDIRKQTEKYGKDYEEWDGEMMEEEEDELEVSSEDKPEDDE